MSASAPDRTRNPRSRHDDIARFTSRTMHALCVLCTVLILAVLGLVTGYLVTIGAGSLTWDFFTQLPTGDPMTPGGMRHAVVGTAILIALSGAIGVPIGMLAGVYLSEYAEDGWLANTVRFVADVLTGVPSIVVGILGYELIVVPAGHFNGWAGALALAFIIVPIVTRTTEEMLRLVPHRFREASIALGASKARTILQVVLPSATGSLITGVMLALARVAGETAPLLFTALGSRLLTTDPSEPFPSLTVQVYNYAMGPYPEEKRLAWAGILVLVGLIFVLNVGIRFATRPRS